jgi:Putative MetA-pathway of phenol degradation
MKPIRSCLAIVAMLFASLTPALAGPPYVSDDPQPTDYKHFEIYAFTSGTQTIGGTSGQAGIDFNYGAAPDLQLTAVLPGGFGHPVDGPSELGLGNFQLAAKYRFLHQDNFGLDVSFFPRLFLPSTSAAVGDLHSSILLPLWLQKDWGAWSVFGGGGCVISSDSGGNHCLAGGVVTRQVTESLRLGIEVSYQSAQANGVPSSTALGLGAQYDFSDHSHLLGYINRGIQNANETDQVSWYTALLFTF